MPYIGIRSKHYPTKELEHSRIIEIVPDVWEIEGYISTSFFFKPPSSNIFIFRDDDDILLLDTGLYPYYRKKILDLLSKYRKEGAKNLTLLISQGHFDHIANNDIILETHFDSIRFLLPEAELMTINMYDHWIGEFKELENFYNPYSTFPILIKIFNIISTKLARSIVNKMTRRLFRGIEPLVDKAEILPMKSRIKKKIGDVEFMGWPIGRFFIIHDGAHSPGHISLYDPKYKLLMTGDATIEINPAFYNSSLIKCIDLMSKYRTIAEKGYVDIVVDSHHSSTYFPKLLEKFKTKPLHPIQIADMAKGKAECVAFLKMFEDYYISLKDEVLSALSKLKKASIPDIMKEVKKSDHQAVKLKVALKLPKFPSRLDILVAVVLRDLKIPWVKQGKRVLFISNEK